MTDLEKGQILDEEEYFEKLEEFGEEFPLAWVQNR